MHDEAHFDSLYGIIDVVVDSVYGFRIGDIELPIGTCHHHGLHIGVEVVGERNQPPQAVSIIGMSPTERPPMARCGQCGQCGHVVSNTTTRGEERVKRILLYIYNILYIYNNLSSSLIFGACK